MVGPLVAAPGSTVAAAVALLAVAEADSLDFGVALYSPT